MEIDNKKFRPNKSSLDESLKEEMEISTGKDIIRYFQRKRRNEDDYIAKSINLNFFTCTFYSEDYRKNGYYNTYKISAKLLDSNKYIVLGFTNAPVTFY